MDKKQQVFLGTCHQIIRKAIRNSGFLPDVSETRLGAIITNNLELALDNTASFKKRSSLAIAVEHFESACGENPDEKIIRDLINDKHSVIGSQVIESVIGAFQTKLGEAREELTTCHGEVVALMDRYNVNFEKFNRVDKTTHLSAIPLKTEIWSGCGVAGPERTLIGEVNALYDGEDEKPSIMAFSNFVNKLKMRFNHDTQNSKGVIIPEEKKALIASSIASASGLGLKYATELVDMMLSASGVNRYISQVASLLTSVHGEVIDHVNDKCTILQKFFKGYDKVVVAQADKETYLDDATVKTNVVHLKEVQKGFAYYLCYLRYNHFEQVLILPNGSINHDARDVALSSGITKDDMRKALFFKEHAQVGSMLTIDYMKNNVKRLDRMHNNTMDDLNIKQLIDKKTTVRAAFDTAIREQFKASDDLLTFEQLSSVISSEVGDGAMEPVYGFFKLVMKEKKVSPLAETLYSEFGKGYASLEQQGGLDALTDRALQEVQAAVLVKQIGAFIKSSFCS